jgi:hypothetical protein
MNVAKTILTLMLCAVCVVRGHQTARVVHVGGDVPKPGPVNFEGERMTLDSAMGGVGMDLGPFYTKGRSDNDGSRCPIRVIIIRQGQKTTYDPSADATVMRALPLELNDTIAITDFREHPKKIEDRKQRIERMLELGSTEIGDELFSLATLQHEYEEWRGDAGAAAKASDEYLRAEAAQLIKEGKGQKIVGILTLKLGSLQLNGLGPAHPVVKSTTHLIQIFRDLTAK